MRNRDAGVLLVSGLAIFLALESGTDFEVKRRWALELRPTLYRNGKYPTEHERVPRPLIEDLDGDGRNEIIVATRDPKLKVLDPQHPVSGEHKGLPPGEMVLRMKAETTLLSQAKVRSGRQVVAMNVGHTQPASVVGRRKVVVVLLQDWTVMCFDHHLKLLWESNPVKAKVSAAHHREATISVTPTQLRPYDQGLVIVGGSMEYDDHRRLHRRKPKKTPAAEDKKGHDTTGARDRIKAMLGLEVDHHGEDQWTEDHDELEETLEHFNYFAFDGKRGALRWRHRPGDFVALGHDHEMTVPQHNYKLELHTEFRHTGEVDWRQYRGSVLHTLPHMWRFKEDTRMYTSHFSRKTPLDFDQEKRNADAHHAQQVGLFSPEDPFKGAGKSTRPGTRSARNKRDKSVKRQVLRDTKKTKKIGDLKKANVLVTHRMEGLEVLHLHTGRTLCQLPMPPHVTHTDINSDGAIDRLESVTGHPHQFRPEGHQAADNDDGCHAWVVTGTPPTHSLYNNSICVDDSPFKKLVQSMARQSRPSRDGDADATDKLQTVAPVTLRRGNKAGGLLDSVFLVSDGTVTSLSGAGQQRWQAQSKAYWVSPALLPSLPHDPALAGSTAPILAPITPTLSTMPLKAPRGPIDTLLALGQEYGVLLTADGDTLAEFELPDAPIGPPAIGDMDHDGYTDIVLHCRTQLVGLSVSPRSHRKALGTLMGGLLLLLVALVIFQTSNTGEQLGGKRRVKMARATD
uniref:FG-GAP repeat-containing protein n=2 Tax=Hemiselmis andersenii TaxID=464988 RepID=A0A6U4M9Z2_HEMAN|mmetsp:Transcript_17861/g.41172  ORF Transcript_17861/g.41172 Transcript_17861/m.41172 type:complete len:739 (+) Transcript_17861:90-2306(+)